MIHPDINIVDFIQHPNLLNDQTLSKAQMATIKTIYGLPLDEEESEIYQRATGRVECIRKEQNEATIIVGRRGGKTSRIAAPIACFEAFRENGLPPGEKAYVVLIAPVTYQARNAFEFIRNYIQNSPELRQAIVAVRKDEIDLCNGVTIACWPCSYVSVRGFSVLAAICDEIAFWNQDITSANPVDEVLDALRPAMATFPRRKLLKISTPFRRDGLLWREYQKRSELSFPVWHLPSLEMNPNLDAEFLEKEKERDLEKYRREYMAEFTDHLVAWIVPEILDPCIIQGRVEVPPIPGARYAAAIDPAFSHSDFTFAIVHQTNDGQVVVDRIQKWSGTKIAPVPFERVCSEIAKVLREYGINRVWGDQFCASIIRQTFDSIGIQYEDHSFRQGTRTEIFGNLRHLLTQGKIELLDNPDLTRQLRRLEEHKTKAGQIDVRPAGGKKDDVAIAVALAVHKLTSEDRRPPVMPRLILGRGGGSPLANASRTRVLSFGRSEWKRW